MVHAEEEEEEQEEKYENTVDNIRSPQNYHFKWFKNLSKLL